MSARIRNTIDPINYSNQNNYNLNGLTVVSNNLNIINRDTKGNITFEESGSDNKILVIETVRRNINKQTFLNAVNTNFEYFSFPVNIVTTESNDSLDINLDTESDPIYARYRPSENRKIIASSEYSGILINETEDGISQRKTNGYYISKEVKNSGANLRFRININHRLDSEEDLKSSTVYFSIIKSGPKSPINRKFKEFSKTGSAGEYGMIKRYEVWNTYYDIVINNSEFDIGDVFSIGALCGHNDEKNWHTITADQTYWVITDASKNVDEWNQVKE